MTHSFAADGEDEAGKIVPDIDEDDNHQRPELPPPNIHAVRCSTGAVLVSWDAALYRLFRHQASDLGTTLASGGYWCPSLAASDSRPSLLSAISHFFWHSHASTLQSHRFVFPMCRGIIHGWTEGCQIEAIPQKMRVSQLETFFNTFGCAVLLIWSVASLRQMALLESLKCC